MVLFLKLKLRFLAYYPIYFTSKFKQFTQIKSTVLLCISLLNVNFLFSYFSNSYNSLSVPFIQQDGSYILVNKTSKRVVSSVPFEFIGKFYNGIAFYEKGGKYGFISELGKIIIPAKYNAAGNFHEGFARVSSKNKFGFVNVNGESICEEIYDDCGDFKDGAVCVKQGKKWGFIDKTYNFSIVNQYDQVQSISNGLAKVEATANIHLLI